ncbi:MAG: beta-agarase [Verrucomicrobiota bacterium]
MKNSLLHWSVLGLLMLVVSCGETQQPIKIERGGDKDPSDNKKVKLQAISLDEDEEEVELEVVEKPKEEARVVEPPEVLPDGVVKITLFPDARRTIGGETSFDRRKYITIHESPTATDLFDVDFDYLVNDLEISFGRDGGIRTGVMKQIPANQEKPDYPDLKILRDKAAIYRERWQDKPRAKPEITREVILCTHPESFFAKPDQNAAKFGPITNEGAAEFTAQFLKEYWGNQGRPRYLEVFNEPFVHAEDVGATIEEYCKQHVAVAKRIHALTPEVLVGGYAAAWAEVEANNFGHWEKFQKKFMDLAGEQMDFFSTHIYDGVNVTGEPRNRTGSNSYAIIDLIDQYSYILFGYAKPQIISEYGLIPEGNMDNLDYSAARSARMIRSANAQLMTFMDHPDRLLKTIPFFLGKALWTYDKEGAQAGKANPFLLWRRLADGQTYEKTDLVKFYEYWKGIHGDWLYHRTSDPDLRCHFLLDGKRRNIILSNLDTEQKTVWLKGLQDLNVLSVTLRSLRTDGEQPELTERTLDAIPEELEMEVGESVILMVETEQAGSPTTTYSELRYYATDYMKPIEAGVATEFTIKDVSPGAGDGFLRLSFGREHGTERKPEVTFNGVKLYVPEDWAGDGQEGRKTFFGMLEIYVPAVFIEQENTVQVTFPDTGGKVACAILQFNRIGE